MRIVICYIYTVVYFDTAVFITDVVVIVCYAGVDVFVDIMN